MTFSNKQRTDVILFHSAESYTVCVGREGVVKAIVWKEGKTFLKEKNKYCIQNTTDCLLALQHNAAGKQHLLSYTGENWSGCSFMWDASSYYNLYLIM